jgi:hypothetical protein
MLDLVLMQKMCIAKDAETEDQNVEWIIWWKQKSYASCKRESKKFEILFTFLARLKYSKAWRNDKSKKNRKFLPTWKIQPDGNFWIEKVHVQEKEGVC